SSEHGLKVMSVKAPRVAPLIRPKLYCRDQFPEWDHPLGDTHEPRALSLRLVEKLTFFENHVAVLPDGRLHPQTFLRNRWKLHGGVERADDEAKRFIITGCTDKIIRTVSDQPLYW